MRILLLLHNCTSVMKVSRLTWLNTVFLVPADIALSGRGHKRYPVCEPLQAKTFYFIVIIDIIIKKSYIYYHSCANLLFILLCVTCVTYAVHINTVQKQITVFKVTRILGGNFSKQMSNFL